MGLYFQISYDHNSEVVRQLDIIPDIILDIIPAYLWRMKSVLKQWTAKILWSVFSAKKKNLYVMSLIMIRISEPSTILDQNRKIYTKTQNKPKLKIERQYL